MKEGVLGFSNLNPNSHILTYQEKAEALKQGKTPDGNKVVKGGPDLITAAHRGELPEIKRALAARAIKTKQAKLAKQESEDRKKRRPSL